MILRFILSIGIKFWNLCNITCSCCQEKEQTEIEMTEIKPGMIYNHEFVTAV